MTDSDEDEARSHGQRRRSRQRGEFGKRGQFEKRGRSGQRGQPNPLSPERVRTKLERSALHYLERYSATAARLRSVLLRRLSRWELAVPLAEGEAAELVDTLVAKLQAAELINDRAFAEGRALSLARRGKPKRAIAATLRAKGVHGADIDSAMESLAEELPDIDRSAAAAYARRRRLGPYRRAEIRTDKRDKDIAAMARTGFAFGLAQKVIDTDTPEALEAWADADRDDEGDFSRDPFPDLPGDDWR